MNGWFHSIPPRPQQSRPSIAPEDVSVGNVNPNVGVNSQVFYSIRSAWPHENWAAQRGAVVAAQLATPVVIAPPTTVFRKPTASLAPVYHWQGSYALLFPPTVVSGVDVQQPQVPTALPYVSSTSNIRSLWPEPQWEAQAEATLGSIFAQAANSVQVPNPPLAVTQSVIAQNWPREDWRCQSEGAVAGALAPTLPGPLFVSRQATLAQLLTHLWPHATWSAQTAPHTMAWLPKPIIPLPAPVPHPELYSWPQEQWKAQSAAIVAGQLSSASQQIPPLPVKTIAEVVSIWGSEQWAAQGEPGIASGLAPIKPPTFVSTAPLAQSLSTILGSWPQPAWNAQTGANIASLFSQAPPVQVPAGPTVQDTQWLWPQESWKAQGSPTTASLLAQLQVPPNFLPNSPADNQFLSFNWPREEWRSQRAPLGAAWIQLLAPVPAQPASPPHIERLLWQQEQWDAQTGAKVASGLATAIQPQPKAPVQQQIISIWPTEQWSAQQGSDVASQFALVYDIPFVPNQIRLDEVLAWPQEQWGVQTGANVASTLVSIPNPLPPAPVATLGTIRFSWPRESWSYQTGARNAAAFAPAPPVVPFISLPQRTQLVSSWPQEAWKAQQAPNGAYISATVQPPPPPPPPVHKIPQKPVNLGYKVTTRTYNLLDMVSRSWGGEFRAPDHRVYEFSNGRGFDSTDMGTTGIYRKR